MFAGYTWPEWSAIPLRERVDTVAHFRLHGLVEQHSEDAVSAAMDARARKAKKSSG